MKKQTLVLGSRLAGLMLILCGPHARADELRFPGGDVLVGNYIRSEEGRVIFDSPVLGRIAVAEADVKVVRSGAPVGMPFQPLATRVEEAQGEPAVAVEPAAELTVAPEVAQVTGGLSPLPAGEPADAEETRQLAREQSLVYRVLSSVNPFKGWNSKLSFGYTWESTGVRTEDLTLMFEAERKGKGSDFKFNARYDYGTRKTGELPQELARDRFLTNFRYREDIGTRLFFQADANYQKDRIKDIKHEFRQNAGIGWRVFTGQPLSATLVPKLTLRYKELGTRSEGWDFLLTLSQDLRYKISDRMALIEAAWVSWDPDDFRRSLYGFSVRLENRITDRVFVDLAYETEFDYEVDVGIQSKSQRTLILVGYKF